MKKTLAIVSNKGEMCGNAIYTDAIAKEFSKHYDVDILQIDVWLLSRSERNLKKKARKHFDDIIERSKRFDYINIQFESCLYGYKYPIIFKRLKKLILANINRVNITLHRIDYANAFLNKDNIKLLALLKFKEVFSNIKIYISKKRAGGFYSNLINFCKIHSVPIIVHTGRDKKKIANIYYYDNVHDRPISFLTEKEVAQYKQNTKKEDFLKKYFFKKFDVIIGVFGFISGYKGVHIAIEAMKYLPDNYKLCIFGSQHPLTIREGEDVNDYILFLMNKLNEKDRKRKKLIERVFFYGSLTNKELIKSIICCDFSILPYLEVNQSGSGLASLMLELGANILTSYNHAFIELQKYAKNCFKMFSIGNYFELISHIKSSRKSEASKKALESYLKEYNMNTNILFYKKIFENMNKS